MDVVFIYACMRGQTGIWMSGCMDGWIDGLMDGLMVLTDLASIVAWA